LKELHIGVLIIGSLLWDDGPHRRDYWRAERLDMGGSLRVGTRTRYGRRSVAGDRRGQYTMVFSENAGPSTGYIVPCRRTVDSVAAIIEEADELAAAEGLIRGGRWEEWGAVGLLRNSNSIVSDEILMSWSRYFRSHVFEHTVHNLAGPEDASPLDPSGYLSIKWPDGPALASVHGECDLLLAAANVPTLTKSGYAMPAEIALSLVESPKQAEYFLQNVVGGIRTADDLEIWQSIKNLDPTWASETKYQLLDRLLTA
jgi:hypothetical protein